MRYNNCLNCSQDAIFEKSIPFLSIVVKTTSYIFEYFIYYNAFGIGILKINLIFQIVLFPITRHSSIDDGFSSIFIGNCLADVFKVLLIGIISPICWRSESFKYIPISGAFLPKHQSFLQTHWVCMYQSKYQLLIYILPHMPHLSAFILTEHHSFRGARCEARSKGAVCPL